MGTAPAEVGSTANNYEILTKLAEGGMAEIFLARGASSGGVARHVVLKRVLRERAADALFVKMFLDEARLAAQLQHPNIAQVYDIGKLDDSYFFTMEYVHGETVRAVLQRAFGLRRTIPIGCVLTIAAGAAAGLHHAHELVGMTGKPLGIVHRDVSPSNLMVSYDGHTKLVDFGVAKATDRVQETRSGTVKGKISYLSPEQCRGATDVDRRSDLFALGIVMWEMLTTERLFKRESDFENMVAIVQNAVPAPSTLRPEVPPALDAIVMKLLAKQREARYQTADEVVDEIERVATEMSSVLSSASVGRFLRELFGQRPPPWMELTDKPITVTSEPLPSELLSDIVDQLSGVRSTLSGFFGAQANPVVATPSSGVPLVPATTPIGVDVSASAPVALPGAPTELMPAAHEPPAIQMPSVVGVHGIAGAPSMIGTPALPQQAHDRSDIRPLSYPQLDADDPWSRIRTQKRPTRAAAERKRNWPLIISVVGIVCIGIAIGIVLGSRDDGEAKPIVVTAEPPKTEPKAEPVETAKPAEPTAPPAPKVEDKPATTPVETAAKPDPATEAIAACKARDVIKARKLAAGITGAKRQSIAAACQAMKLALDPTRTTPPAVIKKPPAVDCAKDPLACPR